MTEKLRREIRGLRRRMKKKNIILSSFGNSHGFSKDDMQNVFREDRTFTERSTSMRIVEAMREEVNSRKEEC